MSILISGMEMPKDGSWTTVRIYPDGTCAVPNWQGDCTLIKGAKAVIDKFPKWIPVTERPPEQRINQNTLDFEYVLCATTFGDVRPLKYGRRIGQGDAHFWNGAGYVDEYVTHWMPLPEPPKG